VPNFGASTFLNSRATLNPRRGEHDRVRGDRHGGCDVEVHARPAALRVRSSRAVLCVDDAREARPREEHQRRWIGFGAIALI
jgi:hypothetical protein